MRVGVAVVGLCCVRGSGLELSWPGTVHSVAARRGQRRGEAWAASGRGVTGFVPGVDSPSWPARRVRGTGLELRWPAPCPGTAAGSPLPSRRAGGVAALSLGRARAARFRPARRRALRPTRGRGLFGRCEAAHLSAGARRRVFRPPRGGARFGRREAVRVGVSGDAAAVAAGRRVRFGHVARGSVRGGAAPGRRGAGSAPCGSVRRPTGGARPTR